MEFVLTILIYGIIRQVFFNVEVFSMPKFHLKKFFGIFNYKNRKWQRLSDFWFHAFLILISHELVLILIERSIEQFADSLLVILSSLIGFKLIVVVSGIAFPN